MPPAPLQSFDDEPMTRYLLGTLSDAETERLDELSIVDDDFAARLTAAEHELVDAYVRGTLSGSARDQFEARYLSTPTGRDKLEFARALASARSGAAWTAAPRRMLDPRWALAAAAVILIAAGLLLRENLRLRRELADVRTTTATLEERAEQVIAQLGTERQAGAEAAREVAQLRDAIAELERRTNQAASQPVVAVVTLTPATRGPGGSRDVNLAADTTGVRLQLPLEGDDFPRYQATIFEASTGGRVWQSGRLIARASGTRRILAVTVPASQLKTVQYVLELAGVPQNGPSEPLNTYPFRVVRR